MKQLLLFILIVLLVILLIKFFLESNHSSGTKKNAYNYEDDPNAYSYENAKYKQMVDEVQKDTIRKINRAVEQGYAEGFQSMNNNLIDTQSQPIGNQSIRNNSIKNNSNVTEGFQSYLDDDDNNNIDNTDDIITYNSDFKIKTIKNNSRKFKEHNKNKNNNDNVISYLNKDNSVKLMLFYKPSCPYCSEFMPVWYKIVNNLSNNTMYEEIDCEKDYKKANEYQITSVPTIILLVNNEKKMYIGDRNYKNIMRFLKNNGINLVERTFEEFDSTGYDINPEPTSSKNLPNTKCPAVTFDKQLDIAQDNYMFQIFNADGQYGYAEGGNNPGKTLTPFTAAYSTIDSYLTSLPEGANISECANSYQNQIMGFGLCNKEELDKILEYQTNVANGNATPRLDGTDYRSNTGVVTAIKNACGL